jgi:hypothetical protein
MTEPKAVKAWAVVDCEDMEIDADAIYASRDVAADSTRGWPRDRVIPVTITPGHEAEDAEV